MDYQRIYREFIADRKAKPTPEGYTERHHILPRSLGGSDDAENLIRLTAREHYFAHCCLAKMHGGKMWAALAAVANMAKREEHWLYFCRRRMVDVARAKAAQRRSEHMTELWSSGSFKRVREYRPWSAVEKAMRREAMLGRKNSPESIKKARATRMSKAQRHAFVHIDGRKFDGTQLHFRMHSGLSQPMVSFLVVGKILSAKGWMLRGGDPKARNGRDPTVRRFEHKDGRVFVGTVYDFHEAQPHIDGGSLSKLVNGKLGTTCGWRAIQTEPNASSTSFTVIA